VRPPLAQLPLPHGITRQEACCLEALAYLAPGGWQTYYRLNLTATAKEADLEALCGRGLVERRATLARDGRGGTTPGTGWLWRLTREGWALASACGWPAWADEDEERSA
jgi:hypothetical protein